jgi:3-oxoacyl-[acyl-carrier protein] reductase
MEIDLSNRIALITGASGQLGRTMVRTLASCGAAVAIHYHANEKSARQLQAECAANGYRSCLVKADVSDFDSVARMKEEIGKQLGAVDIVVANAVVQYDWKVVLEQNLEDYFSQFKTCTMQGVHLAKVFVPDMARKQYGRIIGINTECAMECDPHQSAYASAKRGMDGFYRVLAKEVGVNAITVNQVAPGWTITEAVRSQGTVQQSEYEATIPLKRRGTDQEIANVVAFIASDLASFITGAYIPVCGGRVMPTI